ncbi:MAG: hypothetical protein ACLTSX_03150 [Collinsella sp.]
MAQTVGIAGGTGPECPQDDPGRRHAPLQHEHTVGKTLPLRQIVRDNLSTARPSLTSSLGEIDG